MSSPPVALTIAGSDCCGGAGIQADLKTFSAFGVHGLTAVTSVVAETPHLVAEIYPVPPATLQAQLQLLLDSYPIAAVKTGMLGSALHVVAVAELLEGRNLPLVVDPVLVASSGHTLSSNDVLRVYRERLLPLATIATPNIPEAAALCPAARSDDALALAQDLGCAVLITGGHRESETEAIDLFSDRASTREFRGPWVRIASAHGTGCTLSAAIAAGLARGEELPDAIDTAKRFVTRALREAYEFHAPGAAELTAINQLPGSFFPESDSK